MGSPNRLELYVRSLEPGPAAPAQAAAVTALEELTDGTDLEFDVTVWGDALPVASELARTDPAETLHEAVDEIREWAAARGSQLPGLERIETDTMVGVGREAISLPRMALVAYDDGEVSAVAPRTEDGEHRRVCDLVERLEEPDRPSTAERSAALG